MHTPFEQTRLRLESLTEINQLLMSAQEPEAVLQEILASIVRLFVVEGCSIALIDDTARQLAFVLMVGPARVEEFRIALGQSIAGWVAQTGQGVVSNDVSQDPRFFQGVDRQTGFTTRSILANVHILAATNLDLHQAMRTGAFREDLYYRLNVVTIPLPPLRNRREDIPGLVHHFLERYGREMGCPRLGMDPSAMELLQAYRWPDNVRELQNVIERAVVLSPGPEVTVTDLPAEIRPSAPGPAGPTAPPGGIEDALPLAEAVKAFKRAQIRQALEKAGGNREQAANLLGLAPTNLSRLMKNIGLR